MSVIALYLVIFGAIPFIIFQPYIGSLMWAWIAYMAPHKFAWGSAYYFPFAQVVAIATIGAWLLSREPKRLPLTGATGVLVLLGAWISVTTFFALSPAAAEEKWQEVIKIILMSLITFLLIQSRTRIFWLVVVIVASIGLFGVKGGIFVLATGGEYLVFGPPAGGLAANNAIGLALVMVLPLIRYIQLEARWPALNWLLWISIALCGLSILATYSRGAFLALTVLGAFVAIRSAKAVFAIPAVVVALALGALVMPDKWVSRIETINEYESDLSAMGRLRMWGYGLSVATQRPLFGGGFGIYPATEQYARFGFALCEPDVTNESTANCTSKARTAHNIFMEVLGEHGVVGLALFVLLGGLAFRTTSWMKRTSADRPDLAWAGNLGRMVQFSMVGFLAGGMFMDKAYFDLYYHLVVIVAAAAVVVKRELSGQAVSATAGIRGAPTRAPKPLKYIDY